LALAERLRPAVFLDRDGVINEPVADDRTGTYESPYSPEDVVLCDGAAAAINELRDAGLLLIAVSNQPAAAKGAVSLERLRAVHERVVELLRREGAELDDWRYCFHHPDAVVAELRGSGGCRKPEPGMLIEGAEENGADLTRSWMVGDSDVDVEAGLRAGVSTVLIENPLTEHRRKSATAQANVRNLSAAVGIILMSPDR
jgi:D-glycero-D-manno-heptose 1,7-bisphosphate phosphatase